MSTILRSIAIVLVCGALCAQAADARGRNDRNKADKPGTEMRSQRAVKGAERNTFRRSGEVKHRQEAIHTRPASTGNHRPQGSGNVGKGHGDNSNHSGRPARPGNSFNNNHQGHNGNGGHKQDNNHSGHRPGNGYRPGNGHHTGNNHHTPNYRPNHRPDNGHHYGHHHGHHNVHYGRPHRPHMPPPRPYYRPVPPPPAWRPAVWRPFHTILGVTIGSAINALLSSCYDVCGYDDSVVYLSNVPMLNYSWPAANLYYGDAGLYGSEFVYSTPGYNMRRYNDVYRSLMGVYGSPYQVVMLDGGGRRAVWWGNDGQYITLTFGGSYASGGGLRYYTTLSFGR